MIASLIRKKPSEVGKQAKKESMADAVKNWYADRYQTVRVQRNILAIITILSLIGLAGAIYALALLNASKTFEPYLIQIEDRTGIVTQVDKKSVEKYTADEAVTRYFLVKYLQARESYNVNDYLHFYSHVVRLLSNDSVYRAFRFEIALENPNSPLKLGRSASVHIDIKSMVFLGEGKVQVRFARVRTDGPQPRAGRELQRQDLIATINFGYFDVNLSIKEREINPLGFQVTSYRVDQDVVQ